jgi:hypothetical protein
MGPTIAAVRVAIVASGPMTRCHDDPKTAYPTSGRKVAYRPNTTGSPASSPIASDDGTATTATIAPATRSERRDDRS